MSLKLDYTWDIMDQYRYSPLSKPENIRLLQLLPIKEGDPKKLRCQLHEYALQGSDNASHLYEALSYVWGSEEKPQSIIIEDNLELKITQNLYTVLFRLRNYSFPRIIWVDAICINQLEDTEKQYQIPLMAKIYANASNVLVWLGEAEHDSDQALKAIRYAGEASAKHLSHAQSHQYQISKLLQRPWFQRMWVREQTSNCYAG